MIARPVMYLLALVVLTACAGDGGLRDLGRGGTGPDEFSVRPSLPLELPPEFILPPPTPGGVNRADRNPAPNP